MPKRHNRLLTVYLVMPVALFGAGNVANADEAGEPDERNAMVHLVRRAGADAIPELLAALDREDPRMRYTAAHLLVRLGNPSHDALDTALGNDDVRVRYIVAAALLNQMDRQTAAQYIRPLATDPEMSIRLRFYEQLMPVHFLEDGQPFDVLIRQLDTAYEDAPEQIRTQMVEAVSDLPLTDASIAFLRKVADRQAAQRAAEADEGLPDHDERQALMALRPLLEQTIKQLRSHAEAGQWRQLIGAFNKADVASWPETDGRGRGIPRGRYASERVEARYLLARAYYELGHGKQAERTIRQIIEQERLGIADFRERRFYNDLLDLYRDNYQDNLSDYAQVRERYLNMAMAYGDELAGQRNDEARESYERALELENLEPAVRDQVRSAISQLEDS